MHRSLICEPGRELTPPLAGTDICSLFASHNVNLPVYAGEIQCLALGMAIESWSEDGVAVPRGETGDLVAVKAFPCMPAFFWNDEGGKRYHGAYFERFEAEGVWHHGDFCAFLSPPNRGGS